MVAASQWWSGCLGGGRSKVLYFKVVMGSPFRPISLYFLCIGLYFYLSVLDFFFSEDRSIIILEEYQYPGPKY